MSKYNLQAIKFAEANSTIPGRNMQPGEQAIADGDKTKNTPCYRGEGHILTKWKLKGFWPRLRFLLTGEVSVICFGPTMPPMALRIDNPFTNDEE